MKNNRLEETKKQAAKILGTKGGNTTKKRYGRKHFVKAAKIKWKNYKGKKLSTTE